VTTRTKTKRIKESSQYFPNISFHFSINGRLVFRQLISIIDTGKQLRFLLTLSLNMASVVWTVSLGEIRGTSMLDSGCTKLCS
jgi:hypothetical protein